MSRRRSSHGRQAAPKGVVGGRFYLFTILYGFWFLVGGIVGWSRRGSLLCLGVSCSLGILIMLLGFGHLIEYNRGVPIESFYAAIPCFISLVVGITMTTLFGLGQAIMPSGFVGITCDVAFVIYAALMWRDFLRERNFMSRNTYKYEALGPADAAGSGGGGTRLVHRAVASHDPWLKGSRDPLFK